MVGQFTEDINAILEFNRNLLVKSGGISINKDRTSYAPWLKEAILKLNSKKCSYKTIQMITGIPIKTMENFKESIEGIIPQKQPLSDKHQLILNAWNRASTKQRKGLDTFRRYLDCHYQDISLSFQEMRQILIDLGLRYPRGPKIKDEGAQVKKRFVPHALWEGDGKQMNIVLKGEIFNFCWYTFIDGNTTLLVGSSITATESSASFLKALKAGKEKVGFFAVGILLDNRMPNSDLSGVVEFCREHGIVMARTFPGNSKSNANIENNFSIFERHVGDVIINGNTYEDVARDIALNIAEIFTQQRNHSPRERLGGKTPDEGAKGATRPEFIRSALEALRDRLSKEQISLEDKLKLIENLLPYFGTLSPASLEKIMKQLGKYSSLDIISAVSAYLAQKSKHADKKYGPEYFLAILRNKREERAKLVYNESFRAQIDLLTRLPSARLNRTPSVSEVAKEIHDILRDTFDISAPTERLVHFEALAWWLVGYAQDNSLAQLWSCIGQVVENSIQFTLKSWSQINEYFFGKLGNLLFKDSYPRPYPAPPATAPTTYCQ